MVTLTFLQAKTRHAVWHFDGFGTPALDLVLDERPPTLRGYLGIPSTLISLSAAGTVLDTEAPEIQEFYQRQGLTAADLLRMSARDALDRVSVSELRARTSPPTSTNEDVATRRRGTVVPVTVARQVDNTVVPAELPP